jgi:hypothetical protein
MVPKASRHAPTPLLAIGSGLARLIGYAQVSSPSSPVPPRAAGAAEGARPGTRGRTAFVITPGGSAECFLQPPIQVRSAEWRATGLWRTPFRNPSLETTAAALAVYTGTTRPR